MDRFRVIHIVENLDKGAVENWLVNVFLESRTYRPHWEWTFFCVLGREGRLDERVRQAGGQIIYSSHTLSNKLSFLLGLRQVLKTGQYDAIHMHHDFMNGFYLVAAAGIDSEKILHIHNNDEGIPVGNNRLRRMLLPLFRTICLRGADLIVGISKYTLSHFARKEIFRGRVLYYGIDMDRFDLPVHRELFRRRLDLPEDAKVLLFVGRMNREKNPVFILEVLDKLLTERKDVFAVFIGKGEFQEILAERAATMGVLDHIRVAGWSDDIPGAMRSSDAFLFPRMLEPREGLGLVVVESQCAGLPMLTTEAIVDDAIIIPSLVNRLPLDARVWADAVSSVLQEKPVITQANALDTMKGSAFEIGNATRNLINLYEETCNTKK